MTKNTKMSEPFLFCDEIYFSKLGKITYFLYN